MSMIKEQNIGIVKTRMWQFYSHIRGIMPDMQLQEVALAFTFLRRIDCLIEGYAKETSSFYIKNRERLSDERLDERLKEISGGYRFYNHSGYTFKGILLAESSIDIVLNSYLQGFSQNILEFLDGMNFKHNLAIMQRQSRYLVEVIDFFTELDFSHSSVDNEEFVELISSIYSIGGGIRNSQFHSSLELSNLIGECLFSENVCSGNDNIVSIYDPVCGTGSMLSIVGEKAKSIVSCQDNVFLYGQELAVFPCAIAKGLTLLSGNENSQVLYGNTLTDDLFPNSHFQYIVADMPLGLQWRPFKDRIENESYDVKGRFHIGLPNVTDSQFLFIEHILSKMDVDGSRAAFITSASVLWRGTATSGESRIRRWMFENDLVETIIALPSGTLTATSIPVYLWILSNKKNDNQKGKVRLIDTSIGRKNSRNGIDCGFVRCIIDEYRSTRGSVMSQIVGNEQFGYYEVDLLENGKKMERVTIPLDKDIHEFVEKQRQPYAKGEITIDYTSVEKGYSVQFEKFFKQEQMDVASLIEATKDMVSVIDAIASLKADIEKIEGCSESESWKEYPLRAVITSVMLGANKPPVQNNEGLPVISVSFLRNPSNDVPLYEVTSQTRCLTVMDVAIIVRGEHAGEVFKGIDGILTPSVAAIRCTYGKVIVPQYLYYLLKGYEKELRSLAKGSTIKSMDLKSIVDLKCMIPPIGEQSRLVAYLDGIVGKIDDVIKVLGCADNAFSSYRQTLIENVVRGRVLIK